MRNHWSDDSSFSLYNTPGVGRMVSASNVLVVLLANNLSGILLWYTLSDTA